MQYAYEHMYIHSSIPGSESRKVKMKISNVMFVMIFSTLIFGHEKPGPAWLIQVYSRLSRKCLDPDMDNVSMNSDPQYYLIFLFLYIYC